MPEGPEVRVMTDQLWSLISKKPVLKSFQVISGRYTRHPFPNLEKFQSLLPLEINGVKCHGKLIYWQFKSADRADLELGGNPWFLLNTLGMSGRWSLTKETHAHIEITLSVREDNLVECEKGVDDVDDLTMWFCDPRHFATLTLTQEPAVRMKRIGPDWLAEPPPSLELLKSKFLEKQQRSRVDQTLPKLLMDQSIFSGCGNYLKSEVLYRARLSPFRTPDTLLDEEWERLYNEMVLTIRESYSANGTTLATYASPDGKTGSYFQQLRVYNKRVDPEGREIVKIETPDKRTTHWVPGYQI